MDIALEEANIALDDKNVVEITGSETAIESKVGDKIIILIDQYKTGYECPTCKGFRKVRSALNPNIMRDCDDCEGKGVKKGGIVIPDTAKSLPSTGQIVSKGPDCKVAQLGDRIAIGPHTGVYLPFRTDDGSGVAFKILRETEILCWVYKINNGSGMIAEIIDFEAQPDYEKEVS